MEESEPDINTQPTKTNNDTEKERDKPSSKNVNSDIEPNYRSEPSISIL